MDGPLFSTEKTMKYENKNRFDSVALTSRLEGFIPWFWAPKNEPPIKAKILAPSYIKASPTVYISERRVIIHGLERSGTGFCSEMLRKNTSHTVIRSEHKHQPFDETRYSGPDPHYPVGNDLTKYIIVVRNPYSWVISYENYYMNRASLQNVNIKLTYNHCATRDRSCYVTLWNSVYNKWLEDIPKFYDYSIVRYEDLLEYPKETLTLIFSRLNLGGASKFTAVNEYLNNYAGHPDKEGVFYRKDYYLKKEYMHSFSPESLATINKCLDEELMRKLGYNLET